MSTIFLTGATGLIGGGVLQRMLPLNPAMHAYVLVRDLQRWRAVQARLGLPADRVTPVLGDVRAPGLGLEPQVHAQVGASVSAVLHFAADTTFSLPLPQARAINVEGTRHLLELAEAWPHVERFVYASTAFVAGRRVGRILEGDDDHDAGWVNPYEQCKHEAEALVRAGGREWVIFRPSTVVCDSASGLVRQFNVVHRALRLYHHGLASMLPGEEGSPLDTVPDDYVNDAIARLALHEDMAGQTLHLCAGDGAVPLGEMLDLTWEIWAGVPAWRRRGVPRPAITDLATYRLFEQSVEEAGDARLRQVMQSLSHITPQLAYPKHFDTTIADAAVGAPAPPVRSYWPRMIEHLLQSNWAATVRAEA